MILKYLGIFILIYGLAVVLLPLIPINKSKKKTTPEITIYILTNGMHTDIVVPVKSKVIDWTTIVPFSHTKSKMEFEYVAFGWGDKGFYLDTPEWKDLKFSTAFKAAFWLGDSAMHTTFYREMQVGENCKRINISFEEYQNLVNYIKKSFQYDEMNNTRLIETNAVYGNNDAFYEANGHYNLFFTCNTWAADGLKVAKQKAPLWTATQDGIFYHYK